MQSYRLTDRLKERSSAMGVLIAVLGAVIPALVPPEHLNAWMTAANAVLGLLLALMPESGAVKDAQAVTAAIEADPHMVDAVAKARGEEPPSRG